MPGIPRLQVKAASSFAPSLYSLHSVIPVLADSLVLIWILATRPGAQICLSYHRFIILAVLVLITKKWIKRPARTRMGRNLPHNRYIPFLRHAARSAALAVMALGIGLPGSITLVFGHRLLYIKSDPRYIIYLM